MRGWGKTTPINIKKETPSRVKTANIDLQKGSQWGVWTTKIVNVDLKKGPSGGLDRKTANLN